MGVLKRRFKNMLKLIKKREGEKVKRVLVYVITGILLGVTLTFLPLGLLLAQSNLNGTLSVPELSQLRDQTSEYTTFEENLQFAGLTTFQSSLVYTGLIFITSLILAIGIYTISKRRLA